MKQTKSTATKSTKPSTSTALARTEPKGLAKFDANSMFEQHAGAGLENVTAKDIAIPRISIIQSNSPQVKKADGKFIKGAEEGDFLDSVQNTVCAKGDEGFLFIPCSYRRANIEWIPREKGGGFVADHGADDAILSECTKDDETGAMMLKSGNTVVTTGEFVGIALDADGGNPRQVCISLAKTQFKTAKKVNTYLGTLQVPKRGGGTFNPPAFYSAFLCTSIPQTSKQGQSYMGWSIVRKCNSEEFGQDVVMAAYAMYQAVAKGTIKVAQPDAPAAEPESDDSSL